MVNKRRDTFRTDAADARVPFLICSVAAAVLLATAWVVSLWNKESVSAVLGVLFFVDLGVTVPLLIAYFVRVGRAESAEEEAVLKCGDTGALFRDAAEIGYAIVDGEGVVTAVNRHLQNLLGYRFPLHRVLLSDLCGLTGADVVKSAAAFAAGEEQTPLHVTVDTHRMTVRAYPMTVRDNETYLAVFTDETAYLDLLDRTEAERPVVAYAVLDSLEELAQYVRVSYRDAANEIEKLLKEWARGLGGLIREYDRDKYLLILPAQSIAACKETKFDILERVRSVRLGDNSFPVTVSMGICARRIPFSEADHEARAALDLALQRGGDQVALKTDDGVQYFGGRVKTLQGSTSAIDARVFAANLAKLISESENVIVMGHRSPDFDAIGAVVGAVRFAVSVKGGISSVRAVMDFDNNNFKDCYARLADIPEYRSLFVNRADGLNLIRTDTLLILTDVNNFKILEAPEIASNAAKIVIIDHHRQAEEYDFAPAINHIVPTASSASELVTEMLEQSPYSDKLLKEEAELLLAGMMLDTKNFTHSTGAQTFAAVHYLYERGAHTDVARKLFNEDVEELRLASDFGRRTQIYRDIIAITWLPTDRESTPDDRTAASKAADKLLTVRGIEASFALVGVDGKIVISARSADRINVQLILEKLGGGGHYDMAGAQLADTGMSRACELLKAAIDEYLDKEGIR